MILSFHVKWSVEGSISVRMAGEEFCMHEFEWSIVALV